MERFPTAADHEATCDQMCRQLSLDGPATEATCCTAREILWLLTPCAGTCKCLANRPNDVIDTTQLRYICRSAEAGNPARNSAALIAATSSCHRSSRPARSCLIVNCSGLDCRYVGVFEQCVLTSVLHSMIVYTLEFLFLFCFTCPVLLCGESWRVIGFGVRDFSAPYLLGVGPADDQHTPSGPAACWPA